MLEPRTKRSIITLMCRYYKSTIMFDVTDNQPIIFTDSKTGGESVSFWIGFFSTFLAIGSLVHPRGDRVSRHIWILRLRCVW